MLLKELKVILFRIGRDIITVSQPITGIIFKFSAQYCCFQIGVTKRNLYPPSDFPLPYRELCNVPNMI